MLRECATYQFHDTSDSAPIKLRWDVTDQQRLRSHGGNLAAVLLHLREHHFKRYDLIERQIRRVLPSFGGFELEPTSGKVLLQWRSLDSIVVADFDHTGATQLRRLDKADYAEWLEDGFSLSDIWLQNVIGGRP